VASRRVREILSIVFIGCAFGVDISCGDSTSSSTTIATSRSLDDACQAGRCQLTGSAVITSGPTSDTVGIRLGPGAGTATIQVSGDSGDWEPQALVSGSGSFSIGCGSAVPTSAPADYDWVSALNCFSIGLEKIVTIEVANDGSVVDVADVRVVGQRSNGCH
jgi:hypothetical protein